MKIWYLTSEFPPEFGGGIGMYVDQVSKIMARKGHDITVFVRDTNGDKVERPEKNLRYIRFLHCQGAIYKTLGYWAALAYQYYEVIKRVLESGDKPDVIEIQEYGAIGYYILQNKLVGDKNFIDIPIVVHLHTPVFELSRINQTPQYKFPNYWVGQMEKFCINAADSLVCPSQFLKDQIQCIAPNNPINVINLPYNVDMENYPERLFESNTVLYGGRTEFRKGIYQTISVFEQLWEEGNNVRLRIFGGDPYFHPKATTIGEIIKKRYKKWIDKGFLELNNTIEPEKLDLEILKAKAVIVPSIYENFPYSCVTAMWLGTPMLVSKQGGQAEMVGEDGKYGLIFDWEKNDLKQKLEQLLSMSTQELKVLGENGKSRIESLCNIEKNVMLREEFYENVINSHLPKKLFPFINSDINKNPLNVHEDVIIGKLSIIIPYYNLGKYIIETVESAVKSEYKDKEILIINDGSTDKESIDKLDEIIERFNNVQVINIQNSGLANARNVGAFHAKGEYITFLDADDLIDSTFYSKAIDVLNKYHNVSFVYSWVEYFENGSGVWPTFNTELPYLLCANMLSAFAVTRKNDFLNYGKNRVIMEYGMEDYDGWIGMVENGYFGVSIPEALVKYRIREDSMSRQFNPDMRVYLNEQITAGHKEIYKKYGDEVLHLLMQNGASYKWNNPTFEITDEMGSYSTSSDQSVYAHKAELLRIANSKWGSRIVKLLFKLRLNRLFQ